MDNKYFAQVAEECDEIRAAMFSEGVRDAALIRAALGRDAVVADVGAGTGFLVQGLAPRAGRVIAVDTSAEMLAVARRNLAAFDNVEYRLAAEGEPLPLVDGEVDAVLANMALHHRSDPAAAIRDMARALKPDGRLVITDMDEHGHGWLREEQGDVWLGFDRTQVRAWLEAAGLANVLVQDTAETCRCQSAGSGEPAAVSIFVASAARPDPAMDEAVKAHYRQTALGERCGCGSAPAPSETRAEPVAAASCCGPAQPAAASTSSCCGPATAPREGKAEWIPEGSWPTAAASCCGPSTSQEGKAPGVEVLDYQVDTEADLALGCGNAVGLAALQPGETALDIGCGAGADVFPAAGLVGLTGRVIGVDRLPEMLERARGTAARLGVPNVEFRQGDALGLPAADGEADVVMSNCVINLVQDKGRAFREAHRVLKPGGRLAISDVVTDRPFSPAQRRDSESWAACVAGALAEDEYVGLIRQAGFRDVTLARSEAAEAEDGTRVYSLGVRAVK